MRSVHQYNESSRISCDVKPLLPSYVAKNVGQYIQATNENQIKSAQQNNSRVQ